MSKDKEGGKSRDWGFASYDIDKDNGNDPKVIYTSFEKSGKVNQYVDNGDGHHGHHCWTDKDKYENGDEPYYSRNESGEKDNPSEGDVSENGGCYLTTACMHHYKNDFDDNCHELRVLRWARDNYISSEEIKHYYQVAPKIVKGRTRKKCGRNF